MISRIPTPNTHIDTTSWPIVKVTLGAAPSEDEYRVALGRLRSLRTRATSHFIIVDASRLTEAPSRFVEARIATFIYESAELRTGGILAVAVIANRGLPERVVADLLRACCRQKADVLVTSMAAALQRARSVLTERADQRID